MKNIENWKFSNKYCAIGMLIISSIDLIILYFVSLLIDIEKINKFYFITLLILQFGFLIYITEKKLSQNENK